MQKYSKRMKTQKENTTLFFVFSFCGVKTKPIAHKAFKKTYANFRRRLLSTTLTLENAMSALPHMGVISMGG